MCSAPLCEVIKIKAFVGKICQCVLWKLAVFQHWGPRINEYMMIITHLLSLKRWPAKQSPVIEMITYVVCQIKSIFRKQISYIGFEKTECERKRCLVVLFIFNFVIYVHQFLFCLRKFYMLLIVIYTLTNRPTIYMPSCLVKINKSKEKERRVSWTLNSKAMV